MMVAGPATKGPGAVPLELLDTADRQRTLDANHAFKAAREHAGELAAMAAAIGMPVDIFVGERAWNTLYCGLPYAAECMCVMRA